MSELFHPPSKIPPDDQTTSLVSIPVLDSKGHRTPYDSQTPPEENILTTYCAASYSETGTLRIAPAMSSSPISNQSNPPWSRDELVLALNLYLLHRNGLPGVNHPEVRALSQSLNLIGTATGVSKNQSFRNTNGVCMKLNNFRRWDPSYTNTGRTGLAKGNKDEELVWLEFANNPERLTEVVAAIKANVGNTSSTTPRSECGGRTGLLRSRGRKSVNSRAPCTGKGQKTRKTKKGRSPQEARCSPVRSLWFQLQQNIRPGRRRRYRCAPHQATAYAPTWR